jgi:MerR family redox-sensitive transcriptional activator SoxR
MEEWTIGEVARRAGLRPSAVRYYESVGLLPPPRRINGRRHYDATVLQHLAVIGVAQQAGFTMAEIGILLHGFAADVPPSARWRTLAQQKLPEVDQLIQRAQAMKRLLEEGLDCGCLDFSECVIVAGTGCVETGPATEEGRSAGKSQGADRQVSGAASRA